MKMAYEFNDLKGLLFLVLFTIPLAKSTNIDCEGKPFHCLNSTHFMICVDLGGGISSTIDDFIIPCPPTTVCHKKNRFECEFPKFEMTTPPLHITGVTGVNDVELVSPLVQIVTNAIQFERTTELPLTEKKIQTVVSTPSGTSSPTKIEILEDLKEEYTGGNEKFFEHPTNLVPIFNKKEMFVTTNSRPMETTASTINFNIVNAPHTTEMNNIMDHIMPLNTVVSDNNLKVVTSTITPYLNTDQIFHKPPDNIPSGSQTEYIITPEPALDGAQVVASGTNTTEQPINIEPFKILENVQQKVFENTFTEDNIKLSTKSPGISDGQTELVVSKATEHSTTKTQTATTMTLDVTESSLSRVSDLPAIQILEVQEQQQPNSTIKSGVSAIAQGSETPFFAKDHLLENHILTEASPYKQNKTNERNETFVKTMPTNVFSSGIHSTANGDQQAYKHDTKTFLDGPTINTDSIYHGSTTFNDSNPPEYTTNSYYETTTHKILLSENVNNIINLQDNNFSAIDTANYTESETGHGQNIIIDALHTASSKIIDKTINTTTVSNKSSNSDLLKQELDSNIATATFSNNIFSEVNTNTLLTTITPSADSTKIAPKYKSETIGTELLSTIEVQSSTVLPVTTEQYHSSTYIVGDHSTLTPKHEEISTTKTSDINNVEETATYKQSTITNTEVHKISNSTLTTVQNFMNTTKPYYEKNILYTTTEPSYAHKIIAEGTKEHTSKEPPSIISFITEHSKVDTTTFVPTFTTTTETNTIDSQKTVLFALASSKPISGEIMSTSSTTVFDYSTTTTEPSKVNDSHVQNTSAQSNMILVKEISTGSGDVQANDAKINNAYNYAKLANESSNVASDVLVKESDVIIQKIDKLNLTKGENFTNIENVIIKNNTHVLNEIVIVKNTTDKNVQQNDLMIKEVKLTTDILLLEPLPTQTSTEATQSISLIKTITDDPSVTYIKLINVTNDDISKDRTNSKTKLEVSSTVAESSTAETYPINLETVIKPVNPSLVPLETSTSQSLPTLTTAEIIYSQTTNNSNIVTVPIVTEPTVISNKTIITLDVSTITATQILLESSKVTPSIQQNYTSTNDNAKADPSIATQIKQTLIEKPKNMNEYTTMKSYVLDNTTFGQTIFTTGKTTSSSQLSNMRLENVTTEIPVALNITHILLPEIHTNISHTENVYLDTGNNTSVATQMNVNMAETKKDNAKADPSIATQIKQTLIEETTNMNEYTTMKSYVPENTTFGQTIFIIGKTTSSSQLSNMSLENVTTEKPVALNVTHILLPEIPTNVSHTENVYLDTVNNTSVATQMKVNMTKTKNDKNLIIQKKNKLPANEVRQQIAITSENPIDNKSINALAHSDSTVAISNVSLIDLKHFETQPFSISDDLVINQTTFDSKVNITNTLLDAYNEDSFNKTGNSGISNATMESGNLLVHQSTNVDVKQQLPLYTTDLQGNNTINKESKQTNANQKVVTENIKYFIANNTNTSGCQFDCTNYAIGRYADSKDCRKFYMCIGKPQPMVGTCPNNTVFSDINKLCTRNLSHCVRNNQFHCVVEGRFSDFLNSNIYYICAKDNSLGFLRYKFQCKKDYHLDKDTVKCTKNVILSSQSESSISENSTINNDQTGQTSEEDDKQDDFVCKKEGNFPHTSDSKKYYECSKTSKSEFSLKIMKCTDDEIYDKETKKCVSDESNEC